MEASKQVPVEVRRSLAAEKVANLRNDFFNKKFEELQQRDREKLSALEERGISDTAGYGVRGAQANKMTAREYTRQEFDKIEARARKMRAALAGHAVSGPLTDTQIAYAQTHTMPGRHATAARVTAATRQEMETVPYEDVFGEHTWRVPILEKKADEQGVFQVKAGTEGVIGQHLTPATTGALVHLTGKVKIKPTDDTWRRMEAAAAEAEHGVDRLRDARREFVRIVYRYQKYSSDERRITMKQADQRGMNLPNAPYDRGRALQLMQEFGFRLPEWSKIKVPAAWR